MVKSMTGYGKVQLELPKKNLSLEIKSLNSKQLDINTRTPAIYRERDLEIRNLIGQKLLRGKIDFNIQVEYTGEISNYTINKAMALNYYSELNNLREEMQISDDSDLLALIMRMPDVLKNEKEELDETEWQLIHKAILDTLNEVDQFRCDEGTALEKDLRFRIKQIMHGLDAVEKLDQGRYEKIKKRLAGHLEEFFGSADYDPNRLEQEMVYYVEKLDITEEKIRLKKHCEYFVQTMDTKDPNGKKLGFISQEIGREINTIGAKANDADIQQLVVAMKDELEKVKEQLMNIL